MHTNGIAIHCGVRHAHGYAIGELAGSIVARDDFPRAVVEALTKRAGGLCSFPGCTRTTLGPSDASPLGVANLGVAAHITAASPGGPRFDATLTAEQRSSIENAVLLCADHARLVDANPSEYSVERMKEWRRLREKAQGFANEQRIPHPSSRQRRGWQFAAGLLVVVLLIGAAVGAFVRLGQKNEGVIGIATPTETQVRLLEELRRAHELLRSSKVLVMRTGELMTLDDPPRATRVNLAKVLFGTISDPNERSRLFVSLVESVPVELLRTYPEVRVDNPFVLGVTAAGDKVLGRSLEKSLPAESPQDPRQPDFRVLLDDLRGDDSERVTEALISVAPFVAAPKTRALARGATIGAIGRRFLRSPPDRMDLSAGLEFYKAAGAALLVSSDCEHLADALSQCRVKLAEAGLMPRQLKTLGEEDRKRADARLGNFGNFVGGPLTCQYLARCASGSDFENLFGNPFVLSGFKGDGSQVTKALAAYDAPLSMWGLDPPPNNEDPSEVITRIGFCAVARDDIRTRSCLLAASYGSGRSARINKFCERLAETRFMP